MKSAVVLFIVIALVLVIVPLITIWSLNVLFSIGIPFNVETWAAMVWLYSITFSKYSSSFSSKKS